MCIPGLNEVQRMHRLTVLMPPAAVNAQSISISFLGLFISSHQSPAYADEEGDNAPSPQSYKEKPPISDLTPSLLAAL